LIAGVTLIIEGMLMGPIGPTFKHGKTIGGICGTKDGIGMSGIVICGIFGSAGIGISNVVVGFCAVGSVTTCLSIGV
jgi:hypothetical protein